MYVATNNSGSLTATSTHVLNPGAGAKHTTFFAVGGALRIQEICVRIVSIVNNVTFSGISFSLLTGANRTQLTLVAGAPDMSAPNFLANSVAYKNQGVGVAAVAIANNTGTPVVADIVAGGIIETAITKESTAPTYIQLDYTADANTNVTVQMKVKYCSPFGNVLTAA